MSKKGLHEVGDIVSECSVYECKPCKDVGLDIKETLSTGEYFPQCSGCGETEIWCKSSEC